MKAQPLHCCALVDGRVCTKAPTTLIVDPRKPLADGYWHACDEHVEALRNEGDEVSPLETT